METENQRDRQNNLLNIWKKQLDMYSIIHTKHEDKYKIYNDLITIPLIIITAMLGFTSFTDIDPKKFNYMVSSLNFFCAILLALQKNLNLGALENEHRNLAKKCAKLSNEIVYEINLEELISNERVLYIKNELDRIIEESPSGLD